MGKGHRAHDREGKSERAEHTLAGPIAHRLDRKHTFHEPLIVTPDAG